MVVVRRQRWQQRVYEITSRGGSGRARPSDASLSGRRARARVYFYSYISCGRVDKEMHSEHRLAGREHVPAAAATTTKRRQYSGRAARRPVRLRSGGDARSWRCVVQTCVPREVHRSVYCDFTNNGDRDSAANTAVARMVDNSCRRTMLRNLSFE